jgi:hypothetical protein
MKAEQFISTLLITSLALNGSAAAWSSVRANNRGTQITHAAPHETTREHEAPAVRAPERRERGDENRAHVEEHSRERGINLERGRELQRLDHERRRFDIHEDRGHSYYWSRFHPGLAFSVLPPGYVQIGVGGTPYYYNEGVYYEPAPTGYVVVAPPLGAVVPELPPGVETIVTGDTMYFYAGGAFYVQGPQGYLVAAPPLGVTVSMLPPDAVPTTIHGILYYLSRGTYFLPVMQNGVTVYMTARP